MTNQCGLVDTRWNIPHTYTVVHSGTQGLVCTGPYHSGNWLGVGLQCQQWSTSRCSPSWVENAICNIIHALTTPICMYDALYKQEYISHYTHKVAILITRNFNQKTTSTISLCLSQTQGKIGFCEYIFCSAGHRNESTKVQNPQHKETCLMLISKQTDLHMLCCFAGEVSTLLSELSEAEQLCISYSS